MKFLGKTLTALTLLFMLVVGFTTNAIAKDKQPKDTLRRASQFKNY